MMSGIASAKASLDYPFCLMAQLQKIGLEIPKAWISRKNI